MVLNPRGDPLGKVLLPGNAEVIVADSECIWAVEKDEYDIPSIERYRFWREGRATAQGIVHLRRLNR